MELREVTTRFNPLDYPSCLAFPHRLAPSTWVEHVPFAMFLVEALQPRVFVELGSYYGVSYCAFCQTAKELNTGTRCYAIDTWQGDPQSGEYGAEVLADLKAHHDPLYSSFSRLNQSTFNDAARDFADETIDLLHIDGFHTYEAVKRDFVTWLPKMSKSGVILFHDINVREPDFGVWQLWDELKAEYPHYDAPFGYGLGLLAVGSQQPEAIQQLVTLSAKELNRVRDFFYQLGVRVETAQALRNAKEELSKVKERYKILQNEQSKLKRLRGIGMLQAWSNHGMRGILQSGMNRVSGRLNEKTETARVESAR
jgi:hypothetical protein